uniref:aldehyde dehydrogenase family protein n=1 Tax=Paracoccus sp. TaxID=267 RepID=UPI0028ABDBD8
MYRQFGLFIGGSWIPGAATGEVFSPVTEKSLGQIALASATDTRAAIDAATQAQAPLRDMGGFARADALHRAADE